MEWSKKFRFSKKSNNKKKLYLERLKTWKKGIGFLKNKKNLATCSSY